jgi:SHS2 domain-containing protein
MDEGDVQRPDRARGGVRSPPEGVQELEHTADVGIEVRAPDLAALFHRAALGLLHVLGGEAEPEGPQDSERPIEIRLDAAGTDLLLSRWLREILFLRETEALAYRRAEFSRLTPDGLDARVLVRPARGNPEREIKGVTYHGLAVEDEQGAWRARIIFDL